MYKPLLVLLFFRDVGCARLPDLNARLLKSTCLKLKQKMKQQTFFDPSQHKSLFPDVHNNRQSLCAAFSSSAKRLSASFHYRPLYDGSITLCTFPPLPLQPLCVLSVLFLALPFQLRSSLHMGIIGSDLAERCHMMPTCV